MELTSPPTVFDGTRTEPSDGFTVPVEPLTKILYTYQVAAIEQILANRNIILGMQPGMGKTAIMQAVIAAEAAAGGRSLVVVPPSLRLMWMKEFQVDYPDLKVGVALGGKEQALPDAPVVIMNNSIVQKRIEDIYAWKPTALFVDEAHGMKNPDAKRTKAVLQLSDFMFDTTANPLIVTATGTLANNHAGDVYPPLRITGKDNAWAVNGGGSTWTAFLDRWCETTIAWKRRVVVGCKDPVELRNRLIETCMISIARDEVLDLPARTFMNVELELSPDNRAKYQVVQKHFLAWVMKNFGEEAALRASKAEAITKIMRLWEVDGQVKVRAAADYIMNLVDQGEQVVAMAWHGSAMDGLAAELTARGATIGMLRGGMTAQQKDMVVNLFQAGELDIIVGQTAAAGVGLTLTRSCNIVFTQLPWNPAVFAQATDRIYRIGQDRPCAVHVLTIEEGISQKLWSILQSKADIVDTINNGKPTIIDKNAIVDAILAEYGWAS